MKSHVIGVRHPKAQEMHTIWQWALRQLVLSRRESHK